MANASGRWRSVARLARAFVQAGEELRSRLDDACTDSDVEVLACVGLAACLSSIDEPDAAQRARRRMLERWDVLELSVSSAEALAEDGPLQQVFERVDPAAIRSELSRRFSGLSPPIAAHEWLLRAGDRERRARRGVYTTPDALARYLVERADALLREQLGLELGLADRATWAELAERRGVAIPPGVSPDEPFVRLLDPATGTGVFPLEVARRVRRTWFERWRREGLTPEESRARWRRTVAPELAGRVILSELLPVPRALARWNLADVFGGAPPRVEQGNPLEEPDSLPFPITVVLGNPPYSVRSGNLDRRARALIEPYRRAGGEKVVEKGALRLEMHLQDDYVKFVRLAELQVERAGAGVVALVTNNAWLDSPSLRGMRCSLASTFTRLELLDLHGSRARATEERRRAGDQNVFGIGQGVSTLVGARVPSAAMEPRVLHAELVGSRDSKLRTLERGAVVPDRALAPRSPRWFFVPRDTEHEALYDGWVGLADLFESSVSGIVTAHDRLVVDFDDRRLREHARLLCAPELSLDELRERLGVRDNSSWSLERARDRFRADPDRERCYRDYAYRPFDTRRILYHPSLVWCDRRRVMSALDGERNVALAVCRQLAAPPWRHVFATRDLMDDSFVSNRSRERTHFFPLYRRLDPRDPASPLVTNLDAAAVEALLPAGLAASPEDVLGYVYGVLHAPGYRARHRDSLAADFPRVPPAPDENAFRAFAKSGRELLEAHLPDPAREAVELRLEGEGEPVVARGYPRFEGERVQLNPALSLGPVPRAVWEHEVGAYAPCRKWLKDRVGRRLSRGDLAAFAAVVGALGAAQAAWKGLPDLPAPRRDTGVLA